MIVSHKYRFIFIRVPKTASTSIEIGLSKHCGSEDVITQVSFKNDTDNKVIDYRGAQNDNRSYGSFGVREWVRTILNKKPVGYHHAHAEQIKKLIGQETWDQYFKFCFVRNPFDRAISIYYWRTKNWQNKHKEPPPEINTYILSLPETKLSTWASYTIHNEIAVDFIGRYENLEEDLAFVENEIGIPHLDLPHAKSSIRKDRRHYSEILNQAARAYIENVCSSEIAAFGCGWNSWFSKNKPWIKNNDNKS